MTAITQRSATGFPYLDASPDEVGVVLAFAHRGGAYHPEIEGLENTLGAFRHAVDQGYRYLETDLHVTRDGVLLAFHDHVLDRVTDHVGAIADKSYAEIRGARVGGREAIPTFAELFDAFPQARFNIDLKSEGAVTALADFLRVRDAGDRVLVGSFSRPRLQRFRALTRGRVATSASPSEVAAFLLLTARLARWVTRGRVAALQIPHRRRRLPVTTSRLVHRAHRVGVHVHVWTIDDPAEMGELIEMGVDGLFTDRTDVLKDVLTSRGLWRGSR